MRLIRLGVVCLAMLTCWLSGLAAEFRLITGDVYKGTLAAADKDGLIVRLDSGEYSPRVDWAKLTDETLNQLVNDPKAKRFVEPFIEPPLEEIKKLSSASKEIAVRQPQRVELPQGGGKGLIAALSAPNSLILLLALYAANLYGAFEIARFKWRPVALVCGLSAVLPVIGPIIFLLVPKHVVAPQENATEAALAEKVVTTGGPPPPPDAPRGGAAAALGLSKSHTGGGGGNDGTPKVFRRGETTFNRRFFETQFQNFFRMVATEADRDLVIDVQAGKSSVVASRISRISANEVHFKTANQQEIGVNFADITQVTLRHKDAGH